MVWRRPGDMPLSEPMVVSLLVQPPSNLVSIFMRQKSNAGNYPDSKDHGANMGPTWVLSAPGGPNVGPMNLLIRVSINCKSCITCIQLPVFFLSKTENIPDPRTNIVLTMSYVDAKFNRQKRVPMIKNTEQITDTTQPTHTTAFS